MTHSFDTMPTTIGLLSEKTNAFTCRDSDSIWVGIERALDNGYGAVFVVDDTGHYVGDANLDAMRALIVSGAHLQQTSMGDVTRAQRTHAQTAALTPVLNNDGRLVNVHVETGGRLLPVSEPDLTHLEFRSLISAFMSTWISSAGSCITSFERGFAEKVGMSHGIATSNGTVSLQLALVALGIGEGDEVIVPDLTFAASANTVILTGARPVLVDVDPLTWCMSVDAMEKAITPRTRAVMPVHVFGRPAPMPEIQALARAHGLFVIEDCAEAHGARVDGKPIGSYSDIASFSFFANKIITTGEGGICLTSDPDLASRMRMLRDHGMRPERRYWHEEVGFNFRMTNLQASIGCAQLDRMDELLEMRRAADDRYRDALSDIPGVEFPPAMPARFEPVTWLSCVRVPTARRAELIAACKAVNIDLRPFFNGLSSMPAYRRFARACPESAALARSGLNLPTSRKVTANVAERLADVFRATLRTH